MAGDTAQPGPAVLAVRPPLARDDIATHCLRLADLLRDGGGVAVVDLAALTEPDLVAVELVARLELTATGLGGRIRLVGVGRRLSQLLTLTGLHTVVAIPSGSGFEVGRQAEEREQPLGVEE